MDINNINRKEIVDKLKSKEISFDNPLDIENFIKNLDIDKIDFEKNIDTKVKIEESRIFQYILIYTKDTEIVLNKGDQFKMKFRGYDMDLIFISYAKVGQEAENKDSTTDTTRYSSEDNKELLYFAYDYSHMLKQSSYPYKLFRSNPHFEYDVFHISEIEISNENLKISDIYNIRF